MPENEKNGLCSVLSLLLAAGLLTGCAALPPALTYLSYIKAGADGISYLASHKSTTDHLISSARQEDCAMHRLLWNKNVCKEYEAEETTIIAALKETALDAQPAAGPPDILDLH